PTVSSHRRRLAGGAALLVVAVALQGCPGAPAPSASAPSAAAVAPAAPAAGGGKVVGTVTFNGIDYGLAQGGAAMGEAEVYLDNLPNLRTRTDATGRFELVGVPVGEHHVVAEKTVEDRLLKVRSRVEIAAPEQTADLLSLVLRQTGSLTGTLTLEGKGEGLLGADVFVAGTTIVAKAKDNGAFTFTNMAAGTYNVTAAFPGRAPVTRQVEIRAGKVADLSLDLLPASPGERPARLTGLVVARGGGPLPGAAVALTGPINASTLADEQGRFEFVSVPPGSYKMTINQPGHRPLSEPRTVEAPAEEGPEALDVGRLVLDPLAIPAAAPASQGAPPSSETQGSEAPSPAVLGPSQAAAVGGPTVPGQLAEEIGFPGGTPRTTPFGVQLVGDQAYTVTCAQAFKLARGGGITGVAFSVSQAEGVPPLDCTVAIHRANAEGDPIGAPLRAVVLPAAQIRAFGLGSLFTPVVFAPPVPTEPGQAYAATITSRGLVNLLLSNTPGSFGTLRMQFAEQDQEGWLWSEFPHEETPETTGYRHAVLRVYTQAD
ncbi:MAG: carboxypeptidase regulatory-like domain-containing protein, partial [Candidatus Sericytochromatia bacterium]|nr:carboxypeptidase regulatory-like domain-containing protein [Candidatus Sericytochromatia bacterium]